MNAEKTRKIGFKRAETLIAGIDIAKQKHFAKLLFPDGSETKPFPFENTRDGFDSFISWVDENNKAGLNVVAGIESTGHYWEAFASYLRHKSSIRLVQVNPAHTNKMKDVYDGSPGKTDQKDAGVIAMLLSFGRFTSLVIPDGVFAELRGYAKLREQKIVELGVQRNILHSIVDIVFPEFGSVFSKLEAKTPLRILSVYMTPGAIVDAGYETILPVLRKVSRGQHKDETARKLIQEASRTIGHTDGIESHVYSMRVTIASIERLQGDIRDIESVLENKLGEIPYAGRLLSIRGMGAVTLAVILGETGDISKYGRAEEILKLAGLNIFEISSGKHKGRRRISKRGRAILRRHLFFAALRMTNSKGIFRGYYLRLTETNHMLKMKAMVAISRKLMTVIFAIVRDGSEYDERIREAEKLPVAA